ncbi:pyridoxal phosphate-dependent aminotransferase [Qipengyuania sp. MTN3-11]|uniref:pyridoxal phosphate-dependent aminotransferase n=1 Tax=Qipengyuania sp. MTN3-11 TaxID=3056557 RepID=UPI0036F1A4D9
MSDRGPAPKPWIEAIHAYVPGAAKSVDGRELVKLSANENPLGCSLGALAALSAPRDPARYPDPDARDLREGIGALHGIDPARIVCGTGSGELLQCAVQAYAGQGDEVLFSRYSFSLYPLLAHKVGAVPVAAPDRNLGASADSLLGAVTDRTRVVLLDNPNNPVGSWLPRSEVERLHAGLRSDILLIVDQAYAEYLSDGVDDGGFELAARSANVLVTRTFSKAYGLAAERVGWATGAPAVIDMLNRLRGPFNVSSGGQAAALAALADQDFVSRSRQENRRERDRFAEAVEALGNHGLRAVPSEANFLLTVFEGELSAEAARDGLAGGGYAVRHLPGQGLGQALRITIGTREQMDDIAAILRRSAEALSGN